MSQEINSYIKSSKTTPLSARPLNFHDDINREYTEQWQKSIMLAKPKPELISTIINLPRLNKLIYELCAEHSLSPDIEFTALDTFESLMEKFMYKLQMVIRESVDVTSQDRAWQEAVENFKIDTPLTLLLVLSLSIKLNCSKSPFSLKTIQKIAQKVGIACPLQELVQREFFVFKNLDFVIESPRALRVVEVLARKSVERQLHNPPDMKEFLEWCIDLLRLLYQNKYAIYRRFVGHLANPTFLKKMSSDPVLQGAAVVALAGAANQMSEDLIDFLSDESLHDSVDIKALKNSIQHEIY